MPCAIQRDIVVAQLFVKKKKVLYDYTMNNIPIVAYGVFNFALENLRDMRFKTLY